jgi:hypothetical protein
LLRDAKLFQTKLGGIAGAGESGTLLVNIVSEKVIEAKKVEKKVESKGPEERSEEEKGDEHVEEKGKDVDLEKAKTVEPPAKAEEELGTAQEAEEKPNTSEKE